MATQQLKGIFIQDRSIKNRHLDSNAVDGRVIQDGSVNTVQLANSSITLDKFAPAIRNLVLPNTSIYYALANASVPSADNPFVTRQEVFTYKTNWKDPVQTFDDLPTESSGINKDNDIRLVVEEKQFYTWQTSSWTKIGDNSVETTETSTVGYRKNVNVFTYDFELGQNSEYTMTHDPDIALTRIIQIKERILGFDEEETEISFNDSVDYTESSNYTVNNTLINISSKQVLGSSSVVWESGIVGLLGTDESKNQYRVNRIVAQDSNALPFVVYLNDPLLTSYTGNFYFSNINVSNNEASIIRQKDVDEFTILRDTSEKDESAKNVQVFGSKETGIVGVLSIRQDDELVFNFKEEGSETWTEYNINYLFGENSLSVKAYKFFGAHIITKPQDENITTNSLNNLSGNDMYALAYIESGTKKPFYVVWSHNFGVPIFYARVNLDSNASYNYEDIHMAVREAIVPTDDSFDSTATDFKQFTYKYAVGITASVISPTEGNTSMIALWLNDNVTASLMGNWLTMAGISPIVSSEIYAENPKIVLSPGYAPPALYVPSKRYVWDTKKFSVWITYRDRANYAINTMVVKNEESATWTTYTNEVFLFQMGRSGQITSTMLDYFDDPTAGYEQKTLFDDATLNFKCESKYDFDVALWEDYDEPGLLYHDDQRVTRDRLEVHLRGTPVVVASNAMTNSSNKKYELLLTYKQPSGTTSSIINWSATQQLNKYGNSVKIKVESKKVRHYDHTVYESGYSNADSVHLFFINKEVNKSSVPVHIHNRYGTWKSESTTAETYPSRERNFSDALEYLDYVGITDFDFDFDEQGQINFAAFYGSTNVNIKGLYFSDQKAQCKFAVWSSNLGATTSGPGLRAGFTSFHHNGYIYIQGGYSADGTIDSSMWRLNVNANMWELITTDNAPERVFHVSDVIRNIAYKGSLDSQVGSGGYFVQVNTTRFSGYDQDVRTETINAGSSSASLQSFFKYFDSTNFEHDPESPTDKVCTTEGYRDCIVGYELYNLTSGSHGIIKDIDTISSSYVEIELDGFITEGSRSTFLAGDQIVISYPGRPPFDQLIMFGGGSYQSSRSNGYPDDTNSEVTWPPDFVEFAGSTNIGDNDVYKDARTTYIANLDDRKGNHVDFTFVPVSTNGANNAPVPCISGQLVITDYTRDSIGGISNFPNFVILNRSNAFRFKTSYEQNLNEIGRPFTFLGRWSKLDPIKSSNGEPIEGLNSWKGAKIYHYGGIKPAPEGHATNAYVMSPSVIYFGGFTKSDFTGYYSNSLLIVNALDVNLGWSLIEKESQDAPDSRAGNGIMVVNRQIEDPETDAENVEYNVIDDLKSEVWITCGNNGDLDNTTYDQAKSLNDTWLGRLSYQRRMVNSTLSTPIYFTRGTQDYQAVTDINLNSALGAFMVPNGLRTSNNLVNSIKLFPNTTYSTPITELTYDSVNETYNKYLNDRYTNLSINDPTSEDYLNYNGSKKYYPNWISSVAYQSTLDETSGDTRTVTARGGVYYPADLPPIGERRWTAISRLVITIPEGPGSGDHDVFVGVYNNGIKSVVEYFLPESTQFAFNLAFIELSGGLYNEDPDNADGKSWIDVGTGNLHLQIRNILNQPLGDLAYPYVSSINNTNFVELVGVKWANMTSEIGVKPLKNTWGALVSDSFNPDNVAYFGGRTHNKILLKNTFKWNEPSTYIENEQSEIYSLSEIDGSDEDKWLTLKHGDIVKSAVTAELGEMIDYNVSWRSSYSAWGVAKLIFKTAINGDNVPNNRRPVYYVGFNVIPSVKPYEASGTQSYTGWNLEEGLGFIEFEPTSYPISLTLNSELKIPLVEGQLNYQTGKISVRFAQDLYDYSQNSLYGECTTGSFVSGQYIMTNGAFYPTNIASYGGTLYAIVQTGNNSSTTAHEIASITGNTVTFTSFVPTDESNIPILFSTSSASFVKTLITTDDVLFQIVDINYHTYESPLTSYYDREDFSGTITRNIGDKIGGEYSGRVDSWVYTGDASIDAENISFIQDDRALTVEFDTDDYSATRKLVVTDGNIAAPGNTFTSALSAWTSNLQVWLTTKNMILYIPTQGYYQILSVVDDNTLTVDVGGPYGALAIGTSLDATIFEDSVYMTDVKTDADMPNSVISIPPWMVSEMWTMHALYQDGHSAVTPETDPLNMISDLYNPSLVTPGIINTARTLVSGTYTYNDIYLFGKLIFNKKKASSTDDDIEYYQYFLQETSTSTPKIVGGDQILLKVNGSLQSYDATVDADGYDIPYVTAIVASWNSLSSSFDIKYSFGIKGDSTLGSIANVSVEADILYYNDSSMKLPTEVINPDTYMQWQGTSIKVLFSFDEGATWKKYDKASDIWLAVNAKDIITTGMEFNDLFDIVSWQWSGWNNYLRSRERNLPSAYLGFVEGSTSTIKMLVGLMTEEPSKTPAIDGIVFNTYTGSYWEPKNFYQDGNTYGNDSEYIQVKMIGPSSTKVVNRHSTSTRIRQLKATIMINS